MELKPRPRFRDDGIFTPGPARPTRVRFAILCLIGLVLPPAALAFQPVYTGQVTLVWNASPDPAVTGYYLYYGPASGVYTNQIDVGTNTEFTVTGLVPGSTNFFTANSYTAAGMESSYVTEVTYQANAAPATPALAGDLSAGGITYGQPLGAAALSGLVTNATGAMVPGAFAFATPSAVLPAGTCTEPVLFTPVDTTNYTAVTASASVTVNPVALMITALDENKTYGQTLNFAGTEFVASGLQNGETIGAVTLAVSNDAGAAPATVAGSPYLITPGAAAGGTFNPANYAITYAPGNLTVSPAPLTVTAKALSKTYHQPLIMGGGARAFTVVGLQNGETIGSVTLTVSGNGGAVAATVAGSPYSVLPGAATGGTFDPNNYAITYVPSTLTVNPAPLAVTAMDQTKVYGQTMTFGSGNTLFTARGLQNGETIGTVTLAVSDNGGAASAPVDGSPYTLTPSAATGGTFDPANYAITYAPGTLTITWTAPPVVTLPVTINPPLVLDDGTVQLTFTGGNPGLNYEVQGSVDLQNWTTLTNEPAATNGLPAFIDTGATNAGLRFYRTVTP